MAKSIPRSWLGLMVIVLLMGVWFRVASPDRKVVWVDEVATSLRIAGYTRTEVTDRLVTLRTFPAAELQHYQHLNPEKDWNDTLAALVKSPEHAPLYFVLARLWVQHLGSSIAILRSLSVICSLVALPCLYWVCWELFRSPPVGWLAVALLSVSPFYAAYAQEARPYSLWTLTILLSSALLLRSLRLNQSLLWTGYAIALVIGFYTSLLSILVAVGQGLYVFIIKGWRTEARAYLVATSVAAIAFLPWLIVVAQQWASLEQNTTWMQVSMPLPAMMAVWLYSIIITFVNFPVSTTLTSVIALALMVDLALLGLIGYAFYFLWVKSTKLTWLFVLSLMTTPLGLIAIDLIQNGQRSTAPRYFIPCQLGVLLAIAYLLGNRLTNMPSKTNPQRSWMVVAVILLSLGIGSGVVYLDRSPQYQKTRNLHNPAIAAILNQSSSPLVWAEPNNAMDLISLSYQLKPDTQIYLSSDPDFSTVAMPNQPIFLFNPSTRLRQTLEQKQIQLDPIYTPKRLIQDEISLTLWAVEEPNNDLN